MNSCSALAIASAEDAAGACDCVGARSQPVSSRPVANPQASQRRIGCLVIGSSKDRQHGLASESAQVVEQRAAFPPIQRAEALARRRRFAAMPEDGIEQGMGAAIVKETGPAQAFTGPGTLADAGERRGAPFGAHGVALAEGV